jgi:hypothetical protein
MNIFTKAFSTLIEIIAKFKICISCLYIANRTRIRPRTAYRYWQSNWNNDHQLYLKREKGPNV